MHNIKDIRNDPNKFQELLKKRFLDIDLKKILELDVNNRKLIQEKENLEKEKKEISKSKNKKKVRCCYYFYSSRYINTARSYNTNRLSHSLVNFI